MALAIMASPIPAVWVGRLEIRGNRSSNSSLEDVPAEPGGDNAVEV